MNENLQLGDVGDNVKILQEKLKILGFYNALITGNFGLSTEIGVKAFQKEQKLEQTGIVTPELWEKLIQYTEPADNLIRAYPTLSFGSSGTYVKDLQTKLTALLYFTGKINSNFDLETENAVKRFQLNNNLTANGIVNSQTWDLINSLYGNLKDCAIEKDDIDTDYITYTVVSGDTLYSIARRYNTSIDILKQLNNLSSNNLTIGKILKIPINNNEENNNSNYINYTVVSGDTLYSIARKYNTSVDIIKQLNNLSSNTLSIGQVLKLPTTNSQENYFNYTVVSGDTLYSIARKYNTSVDIIKQLNNLSNNTLSIGQVLKLPTTNSQENYLNYTVVSGDTLYSIANKYNTSVDTIKNLNNLINNTLTIGQILKIPIN